MRKVPLIIAGTNKSGTTSLFRYLSDHPVICPSNRKELQFFLQPNVTIEDYQQHFESPSDTTITLEASPQYLDEQPYLAERIFKLLPDAKLIFVLREPVARLGSFFRSFQSRASDATAGYTFLEFVKQAEQEASQSPNNSMFARELIRGCYGNHLEHWLSTFDSKQIHMIFFDDLEQDAKLTTQGVCDFLEIDSDFYDSYQFDIENKTREYRFPQLHKIAHKLNMRFEPFLNRHRGIKSMVRRLYTSMNEQDKNQSGSDLGRDHAHQFYAEHNRKLKLILQDNFPSRRLPQWLS